MTDKEKIDLLINAQTKENNYLAMRLMLDVLAYDFKKAFLSLKPYKASIHELYLEISFIKIHYSVHLYHQIDVPSDWGEIKRTIYYKGALLPDSSCQYDLDEGYIWSLSDLEAIETFEDIQKDLELLSPWLESLFLSL